MRVFYVWLGFMSSLGSLGAQTWAQQTCIEGEFRAMELDEPGRLYLIEGEHSLYRLEADGRNALKFSENRFGPLSYVDPFQPFQLLLFYKDYQRLAILDRSLNLLREVDLAMDWDIQAPIEAIGWAADGNLWFYDPDLFRLFKIDLQGRMLRQGTSMQFMKAMKLRPQRLYERGHEVWLLDSTSGLWVFDNFGTYRRHYPEYKSAQNLQIEGDYLRFWLSREQVWMSQHRQIPENQNLPLPPDLLKPPRQVLGFKGYFYALEGDKVCIYRKK